MWLTSFDMLLEFHGSIPLHSTIKSLLKINAKCSWSFVGRFLHVSILNPYHKSMEHVPGTHLATSLLIESVLQNLPEPSWANSFKFPCGTTIKNNGECYCSSLGQSLYIPKSLQRKHVPGIHGWTLSGFASKSLSEVYGNVVWASCDNSFTVVVKPLLKGSGKGSWSFLGYILEK